MSGKDIAAAINDMLDLPTMAATASEEFSALPAADSREPVALVQKVIAYAAGWAKRSEGKRPENCCFAFVMSDYLRDDTQRTGAQRKRHFFKNITNDPVNHLYLCPTDLGEVLVLKEEASSVEDIEGILETHDLGGRPIAVVLVADQQVNLLWCPAGFFDEEESVAFEIAWKGGAAINLDTVDEALGRYHHEWASSGQRVKVWHCRDNRVPVRWAEAAIQNTLSPYLAGTFGPGSVDVEIDVPTGRVDIQLIDHSEGKAVIAGILELKVLRSKHFNKDAEKATTCPKSENVAALKKGVVQAWSYRNDKGASLACLCCYDMQTPPSVALLSEVQEDADKKEVVLRHFPIFLSADDYRLFLSKVKVGK